jgi:PKHD-type hydroxylase
MYLKNYYYYFEGALSKEFCDQIIENGKKQVEEKASVTKDDTRDLSKVRDSSIAWMQDLWIYEKINPYILHANKEAGWNFELVGSESCQFTVYREQQHYDWHQDSFSEPFNRLGSYDHGMIRKLSVTISLEDGDSYEGGDLEFDLRNRPDSQSVIETAKPARKKGSIIVFPSFVWHRVTPVTKGTRYSLVIWNIGPPFK